MSSIVLSGDTSGTITVAVPAVAGTNTVTIPAATGTMIYKDSNGTTTLNSNASQSPLIAQINGTEVGRFDTSGRYLVGTTSADARFTVWATGENAIGGRTTTTSDMVFLWGNTSGSSGSAVYVQPIRMGSSGTLVGGLYWNGSAMSLQGTSDYRLKENVKPLENCLNKIMQLNPVSYSWKENKKQGKGFIAHELQAIIPEAVVGEKDDVDNEGKAIPQSIDQVQIICYLTKAIQELKAEINALKADK